MGFKNYTESEIESMQKELYNILFIYIHEFKEYINDDKRTKDDIADIHKYAATARELKAFDRSRLNNDVLKFVVSLPRISLENLKLINLSPLSRHKKKKIS